MANILNHLATAALVAGAFDKAKRLEPSEAVPEIRDVLASPEQGDLMLPDPDDYVIVPVKQSGYDAIIIISKQPKRK